MRIKISPLLLRTLVLAVVAALVLAIPAPTQVSSAPIGNSVLARAVDIELGLVEPGEKEQLVSSGAVYAALLATGELERRAAAGKDPSKAFSRHGTQGCSNRFEGGGQGGANVRVNQDCSLRRQAEEVIVVNPLDDDNLIAGQNAVLDGLSGERIAELKTGGLYSQPRGRRSALLQGQSGQKSPAIRRGSMERNFEPHTGSFRSSLHFRHQLFLALREFLAERLEIHLGGFEFREKLLFLFLDVLLYHFAENPNLGVVEILADRHRFDFRNQVFHRGMFNERFVDKIAVLRRFARLWIENLFFDLRVDLQRQADLLCELRLTIVILL